MKYRKLRNLAGKSEAGDNEVFTVKKKSKRDIFEEERKNKNKTSIFLAVVKWMFTIILFCMTCACFVVSKVSFLRIAHKLKNATFNKNFAVLEYKDTGSDTAFVMLILVTMIPHVLCFLKAVYNASFSTSETWPRLPAIFWGCIGAIFETVGVCTFAFVVVSSATSITEAVANVNAVFIVPLVLKIIKKVRETDAEDFTQSNGNSQNVMLRPDERRVSGMRKWLVVALLTFALTVCVAGFATYVYYLFQRKNTVTLIAYPLFVVCTTLAWTPALFQRQNEGKLIYDDEYPEEPDTATHVDSYQYTNIRRVFSQSPARNHALIITSLVKIILTPLTAFLLNYLFIISSSINPGHSFYNGFKDFTEHRLLPFFLLQVGASLLGYALSWLSCTMNLQRACFCLPLILSTPLSFIVIVHSDIIEHEHHMEKMVLIAGVLMWMGQSGWNLLFLKSQPFLMAREKSLFYIPTYSGSHLEQFVVLNRKVELTDEQYINYHKMVKDTHIYICTTMYHETDSEMEQLLQSLARIDQALLESKRQFEAHIFFDDGVRNDVLKVYALQLLSLLKSTMGVEAGDTLKLETPYGLQLKWRLPNGMPLVLHLKDKIKVKAKKRWSQVMYMSYVLDFKAKKTKDEHAYILATDADVMFTPNDVMALMDFMSRNPKVGAVCGRTHPMGVGPLVWYQIFDYAIGHWLLKVANHVFGSVLCSPGCFSVYRAKAVRDVLPLYATGVDCAMDFLMKDMGEDRWFCTLLVEAGWRLEYCATAENSTYCPDTFDEFFKQRRRWGPSTLANSLAVVNQQSKIRENNDAMNFLFVLYQVVLLISTIIGPSTVLLLIAGGMSYAYPYDVSLTVVLILLIIVTVMYTLICLYCTQDTQLKWAKFLTFVFAIIMAVTIVGLIHQTVDDVTNYTDPTAAPVPPTPWHPPTNFTTVPPPITPIPRNPNIFLPSTWYLFILIGIFFVTALLHGSEGIYLIHGVWYLLCLPSGYLLLTIYSVCNLTDRSWGTREGKSQSQSDDTSTWETIKGTLKHVFWCCVPPHLRKKENKEEDKKENENENENEKDYEGEQVQEEEDTVDGGDGEEEDGEAADNIDTTQIHSPLPPNIQPKRSSMRRYPSTEGTSSLTGRTTFLFPGDKDKSVKFSPAMPHLHASSTVEEWLPKEFQCYVDNFKSNGYESVSFIAGVVKEKDLMKIGISNRGHRKRIMRAIDCLPPEEVLNDVPENVEEWLIQLGLEDYWPMFNNNSYTEPRDLADIKYLSPEDIRTLFEINKEGHLKRLLAATAALQYPTKAQTMIREARKAIMSEPTKNLRTDNADDGEEWKFWSDLRDICLLPEQAAFNSSGELVEKLGELRDTTLMVFAVANVLWLTFMVALMKQGDAVNVLGTSFGSVAFLLVYGLVLFMQFISMLIHRVETGIHYMARAPFRPGHFRSNWSWNDDELPPPPSQEMLDAIRRRRRRRSSESFLSIDTPPVLHA